jgi:long-chain fatty acid transport protein
MKYENNVTERGGTMKKSLSAMVLFLLLMGSASVLMPAAVFATNGMNLEGYGPIATGMGGASMAYDNGTAAMMNNPATLGLMPEGNRLDVALGYLGPHIKASAGGQEAKSSADAFYMPAIGWVQKSGQMSYGVGVFAQGGMGTEYSADSFLAAGSGEKVRSELAVGRFLVPVAYNVNDKFTLGGSLDFVWASLDLKMALNGQQFQDLASTHQYGSATGSMVDILNGAFGGGQLTALNWARFDFSDNNMFTGAAKATGLAAKIGGVYKVDDQLSIGAAYHSKTSLGDMETNGATVSMNVAGPGVGGVPVTIPVTGKIKVIDFQWPQMIGLGVAYHATEKLMLVFDYKWINWQDTMKDFKMTFTADANQSNPFAAGFGLGGQSLDATLFQKWKDQNVFMIGAGYQLNPEWVLRAGLNIANNPIPDKYMNPLFPAIETNHVTLGAGYMISKASTVDASFTYAPEVSQTNGGGVKVTHSQTNAQVMYSYRF